jgi:hypothetical protein
VDDDNPVTTPRVASVDKRLATCAGVRAALPKVRAATPATCGAAIDVPDIITVDVVEEIPVEIMELPGAKMSTQPPTLE